MWSSLNTFVLEQIFSYLDGYHLLYVVPNVCYSWKACVKQSLLPKYIDLSWKKNEAKLTDECLQRAFIEFNLSKTEVLSLADQNSINDRSILNASTYCQHLTSINLIGCCTLMDVSLKYLSSIQTLQSISISLAEVTGGSLHFLSRLPKLTSLRLEKLFRLRLDFLESFLSSFPFLKYLCIRQCKLITHDFFLYLLSDVEMPVLEELILDGLIENKESLRTLPLNLDQDQPAIRFLSLRRLRLFNLTWLQDFLLSAFLRDCNVARISQFSVVRCNPMLNRAILMLLVAPNVQEFCIEGNQALTDGDLLFVMFNYKKGMFKNCSNISDQMKRQMARSNPYILFDDSAYSFNLACR